MTQTCLFVCLFVTGKLSKARCLVMDAVCLAQNRNLIQHIGSSSYGMYLPGGAKCNTLQKICIILHKFSDESHYLYMYSYECSK